MLSNPSVETQIQNLQSLYEAFQQLYLKTAFEYDRQTIVKQEVERKNIQLISTTDRLTHHIACTLQLINHHIKQNTINKYNYLRIVNTKHQSKNQYQQSLILNHYYFRVPSLRFDIKTIHVPHEVQTLVQQFDHYYETDKGNLENQITKLKILIKLAQMNQDDNTNKHSKTRKNL